jgi:AmmeMemoRadiSam system protein B
MKRPIRAIAAAALVLMLIALNTTDVNVLCADGNYNGAYEYAAEPQTEAAEPMLAIRHITHEEFNHSLANPRPYQIEGRIAAGVVPHHLTAATLIAGFFSQAAAFGDCYDLVIILAPNHEGDLANVVLSYRNWDVGEGVFTHRDFVKDLMAEDGINTAISHDHLEIDHSASILIPFIHHYLPGIKVAPVLFSRSLSLDGTVNFFNWMQSWIDQSGKNVLLVASIDFSHFLTTPQAMQKDLVTANAIANRDFRLIHSLNYHYLDSAASLIIFLKYLDALGIVPQIIDHTDATEFLGPGLDETTSYKVIVGAK